MLAPESVLLGREDIFLCTVLAVHTGELKDFYRGRGGKTGYVRGWPYGKWHPWLPFPAPLMAAQGGVSEPGGSPDRLAGGREGETQGLARWLRRGKPGCLHLAAWLAAPGGIIRPRPSWPRASALGSPAFTPILAAQACHLVALGWRLPGQSPMSPTRKAGPGCVGSRLVLNGL